MERIDQRLVEEVARAEDVRIVDKRQADGRAERPGDQSWYRVALAVRVERQQNDRRPGWCPEVGEQQELLVRGMEVPEHHRVCGKGGAQEAAAKRGLPAPEPNAHRQR